MLVDRSFLHKIFDVFIPRNCTLKIRYNIKLDLPRHCVVAKDVVRVLLFARALH